MHVPLSYVGHNGWDRTRGVLVAKQVPQTFLYICYQRGTWHRRVAYSVLVGKPEGKTPLGRPGQKWEESTKTDFKTVRKGRMVSIDLALVGEDACSCECGNELSGSLKRGNFLTS